MEATVTERARRAQSLVLSKLAEQSQAAIAIAMGTSESTINRIKTERMEEVLVMLAHLGLKVVPIDMQCFSRDKVNALLTLARDHLVQMEHPEQLSWE